MEYLNKDKFYLQPLVSVCVQTYQHAKFIRECLDSILKQQTNFTYEVIIGEDESNDGTRQICIEYAKEYSDKIRLILRSRANVIYMDGKPTGRYNFVENLKTAKGKYIAICEGDDYWSDPLKLQKQVDFLEANQDYSICFHRVWELYSDGRKVLDSMNPSEQEITYTIKDLARGNIIHTPSVLFRNHLFESFPEWFNEVPAGDYVLHMLNARYGLIKYLPHAMAVYRIHEASMWSSQNRTTILERWLKVLSVLISADFDFEVIQVLKSQKKKYINELLMIYFKADINKFLQELKKYNNEEPEIGKEWLFNHYPNYIKSFTSSNTYKIVTKIRALKGLIK